MTDSPNQLADRYDRAAERVAAVIDGVRIDQWTAPTPCEQWTVADLVGHLVDNHRHFQEMVGRQPAASPPVADDPAGAFAAVRAQTSADLRDPERAQTTYDGHFGEQTFAWAVDSFITTDLVVHGWDLAMATGQDYDIPPEEISRITAEVEEWGEAARSPEVFGPAVEVEDTADAQTRFLALVGRQA